MAVDPNKPDFKELLMEYTVELFKHRPKQDFKQRLSGNMIPRKQRGVFSVSNLRCSHGLFCTLQPAESVAKWAEKVWEDVEGEVVSKLRQEIMWEKTREEKTTEKSEGGGGGNEACQKGKNTPWQPVLGVNHYGA